MEHSEVVRQVFLPIIILMMQHFCTMLQEKGKRLLDIISPFSHLQVCRDRKFGAHFLSLSIIYEEHKLQ